MLATLYEWSRQHVTDVFEAKSEDECEMAIDKTFSHDMEFIINGQQLSRAELRKFVLTMLVNSGFRLKLQWQDAVEVPRDPSNRDGVLGAYYLIHNVRKAPSADGATGRFTRHKFVNVVIESESPDVSMDSRRVVRMNLTATDKPA
ncbi:hypothetical protein BDW22DRAFT_1407307 [Trametopsis cervina]|nr:hypothetical protein BDW22DRAFT_1407307 [Trametopsis cervina]